MNASFKGRFVLVVAWQMLLLVGLIAWKQFTLVTGQSVLLRTVPVDPRDLFRGDYVILGYEISRIPRAQWKEPAYEKGVVVYVSLRKRGRFWEAESVSRNAPAAPDNAPFLRGTVTTAAPEELQVRYGIESYFVPEGTGTDLERAAGKGLVVEARVDRFGRAAIRAVRVEPNR